MWSVEWQGYVPTKALGGFDVCLNGLLITALQAVVTVGRALGGQPAAAAAKYQAALSKHAALVKKCVGFPPSDGSVLEEPEPEVGLSEVEDEDGWVVVPEDTFDVSKLGFHGAAFLLRAGDILFGPGKSSPHKTAVVGYIKAQLEDCFPINKDAPRLSDPSKRSATGAGCSVLHERRASAPPPPLYSCLRRCPPLCALASSDRPQVSTPPTSRHSLLPGSSRPVKLTGASGSTSRLGVGVSRLHPATLPSDHCSEIRSSRACC